MRILARSFACATVAVLLGMAVAPAMAAVSVDLDILWAPDPDNDTQVYLHASNTAYPLPRERVASVFGQIRDPYTEFPVLAFIAYHGHADIAAVWNYRRHGHQWVDVMFHFGVRPNVLFVELDQPPGPPYGNAYGHWKKRHNRMRPNELRDDDIRFWVGLHTVAAFNNVTPGEAYRLHRSGQRFDQMTARHYREKHADGRGHKRNVKEAGFGPPRSKAGKGHKKNNH